VSHGACPTGVLSHQCSLTRLPISADGFILAFLEPCPQARPQQWPNYGRTAFGSHRPFLHFARVAPIGPLAAIEPPAMMRQPPHEGCMAASAFMEQVRTSSGYATAGIGQNRPPVMSFGTPSAFTIRATPPNLGRRTYRAIWPILFVSATSAHNRVAQLREARANLLNGHQAQWWLREATWKERSPRSNPMVMCDRAIPHRPERGSMLPVRFHAYMH